MTSDELTAKAAIAVNANRKQVWDALISPSAIKQYMLGADVESLWHEGSNIAWKDESNGTCYENNGVILKLEPEKILKYSYFSPLSSKPDNYHIVTILLADGADRTEISLTEENIEDEQSRREFEKNWSSRLERLKNYVEDI